MKNTMVLFLLLLPLCATAADESERIWLDLLMKEIDKMIAFTQTIERDSQDSRVRINYEDIIRDFNKIKSGIADVHNEKVFFPRSLPPIKGKYKNTNEENACE